MPLGSLPTGQAPSLVRTQSGFESRLPIRSGVIRVATPDVCHILHVRGGWLDHDAPLYPRMSAAAVLRQLANIAGAGVRGVSNTGFYRPAWLALVVCGRRIVTIPWRWPWP